MTVDYKDVAKAWDSQKPSGRSNGKSFWLAVRIAIEKQIPKKTITMPFYCGTCPSCNGLIPNKEVNYCSNCGQSILHEGRVEA